MASSLTTTLQVLLRLNFTPDAGVYESSPEQIVGASAIADSLTNGTTADKADVMYAATRTLTAGSNEELDLAGSLADRFGSTLTFARVKALLIVNNATAADAILTVGGAASNAWETWGGTGDVMKVRPGGVLLLWAPDATAYAVTATTGDKLKIANAGSGSASYTIRIVGASA